MAPNRPAGHQLGSWQTGYEPVDPTHTWPPDSCGCYPEVSCRQRGQKDRQARLAHHKGHKNNTKKHGDSIEQSANHKPSHGDLPGRYYTKQNNSSR